MAETLRYLADGLRSATPWIMSDLEHLEGNSLEIGWFLPAEQHIMEWFALNALLIAMVGLDSGAWTVAVPAGDNVLLSGKHWVYSALESLISVAAVATMAATVVYKALTDRKPFLLQPCHVLNLMMIYLSFVSAPRKPSPTTTSNTSNTSNTPTTRTQTRAQTVAATNPNSPPSPASVQRRAGAAASATNSGFGSLDMPSLVFNVYLHSMYGAWLGLLLPDTRDLKLPFEIVSFFTQHVMLCFAPMYFIARGRFNLYHPRILYCWAWKFLYHVDILLPVAMMTASNLNYMMVPAKPLMVCGRCYRPVMGLLCIVLTVLMRHGITAGCIKLFVYKQSPTNKPKKA